MVRVATMDVQTRISLGGTALFTAVGFAASILLWWISGPIIAACAGVAAWGFWPAIKKITILSKSFKSKSMLITLNEQFAYEASTDNSTLPAKMWSIAVQNLAKTDAVRCQARISYKLRAATEISEYFISAPFDLRPSEKRLVPILRCWHTTKDNYIAIYPYYQTKDGEWRSSPAGRPLLSIGHYKMIVEILSSNKRPEQLDVMATYSAEQGWTISTRV
jgi:hypothetical protein